GTGSGGGVRLVATSIAGSGTINVSGGAPMAGSNIGGTGAIGRIRTEAYTLTAQYNLIGTKVSIVTTPNSVVLSNAPTLRISAIGSVAAPTSPGGVFARPDVVLASTTTNPVHVDLAAAQIPLGTTIQVVVRGQNGG